MGNSKIDTSLNRIKIMRNGGQIPCPICKIGKWTAVGNPATTPLFECDNCHQKMILKIVKLDNPVHNN